MQGVGAGADGAGEVGLLAPFDGTATELHCGIAATMCEATGAIAVAAGDRLAVRVDTAASDIEVDPTEALVAIGFEPAG